MWGLKSGKCKESFKQRDCAHELRPKTLSVVLNARTNALEV